MRSRERALIALAVLAVPMGVAAAAIILNSHHMSDRGTYAAFNAALGGSFVGTGLYAWWRRPDNRTGALMVWVGFLWFVSPLEFSENTALFTVGMFTDPLPIAGLAHLILAFPSGRLESRYHRGLVAFAYFTATLLQLPGVLFFDSADGSLCPGCPANPLLISANSGLHNAFSAFTNLCAIGVIALIAREVVPRLRRVRRGERQVYGPVVYAGLATLAAFACLFVSAGIGGSGASALRFLAFATFVTVPYAFLAGLIRGRLSRAGEVAELVEALGRTDDQRQSLRETISAALGDSSLGLAYWIPQQEAYVDAQGQRVELPAPGSGRIATPIERGGAPLAVVIHDESLAEERDLVRAALGAAALTLENERLGAELRARIEELRSSRARIVQAADDERRRLERDLHDGAQQRLVALALNLKLARGAFDEDPDAVRDLIDEAIEELTEATAELRELARGIHPAILTDRGLDAAVNALAGRASVPVEVRTLPAERLAAPIESTAYFVVAEALTNVARYSQASYAEVEIGRGNGTLVVEVRDDGVGGADPGRGSGLRGLADRVAAVDGRLVVTSERGTGTIVHAEIPCAQ
ncbi:MAG: histidine kinase [Thermoleophilaceae bacterium]